MPGAYVWLYDPTNKKWVKAKAASDGTLEVKPQTADVQLWGWDATNSVWRKVLVNSEGKLIVDPSELFEDTPTDGETGKGPTSNWAYDHQNDPNAHHQKVENFLELTDTPASYTGEGGKVVAVKSTEDGLEFTQVSGGGVGLTPTIPHHFDDNEYSTYETDWMTCKSYRVHINPGAGPVHMSFRCQRYNYDGELRVVIGGTEVDKFTINTYPYTWYNRTVDISGLSSGWQTLTIQLRQKTYHPSYKTYLCQYAIGA